MQLRHCRQKCSAKCPNGFRSESEKFQGILSVLKPCFSQDVPLDSSNVDLTHLSNRSPKTLNISFQCPTLMKKSKNPSNY